MTPPPAHGPMHRDVPGPAADVMGIPPTLRITPGDSIGSPPRCVFFLATYVSFPRYVLAGFEAIAGLKTAGPRKNVTVAECCLYTVAEMIGLGLPYA